MKHIEVKEVKLPLSISRKRKFTFTEK